MGGLESVILDEVRARENLEAETGESISLSYFSFLHVQSQLHAAATMSRLMAHIRIPVSLPQGHHRWWCGWSISSAC